MSDIGTETKASEAKREGAFAKFLRETEVDTRLLGMLAALALIWIGFHYYGLFVNGFGAFLTPRNLWNLSVQTSSIGIMATGMVLVIITRHIDLSVGSMLGFIAIIMGTVQVNILPQYLGLGHPMIWIIAIFAGLLMGTLLGAFQGWMIAYGTIPAFIVTLGGLLVWRGAGFLVARGETISPVDATFKLLGGGPFGAIGNTGSWIVGILGCIAVLALIILGRRKRKTFGLPLRPVWAETFLAAIGAGAVIGTTLLMNAYPWPKGIIKKFHLARFRDPCFDPDRRHHRYDHPDDAHQVWSLRLCHRWQPRSGGTRGYQHTLDDRQNLRAYGLPYRDSICRRLCAPWLCHGSTWHAGRTLRHRRSCDRRHVPRRRCRHDLRCDPWRACYAKLADRHGPHRL
jgi:predicted ABC-type sugar transport system permease subunit